MIIVAVLLSGVLSVAVCNEKEEAGQADKANVTTTTGLRFVFTVMPKEVGTQIYMTQGSGKYDTVEVIKGVLGKKVDVQAGATFDFYDQAPIEEKPQGKKLLSFTLPETLSEKMIGVVDPPIGEGEWRIFFLSESDLQPGTVLIKNLLKEPVQIRIESDPFLILQPSEEYLFDPKKEGKKSLVTSAKLYGKKNGQWFVSRQFGLQSREFHAELNFFVWNDRTKRSDIYKVIVAPEIKNPPPIRQIRNDM